MRTSVGKLIGVIVYGLVAGFAATTVTILGPILLALFFVWIFGSLGWLHAREAAVTVIIFLHLHHCPRTDSWRDRLFEDMDHAPAR